MKPWVSLVLGVLFSLSVLSQAEAQSFADGNAAFKKGNYQEAAKIWQALAKDGNSKAQFAMATLYRRGKGVDRDFVNARRYFRLAASQGLVPAQYRLALMYRKTAIIQDEYDEALKWMQMAAEEGYAKAQYQMGLIHFNGEGIPKNNVEAYYWFDLAAKNGIKSARKVATIIGKRLTADEKSKLDQRGKEASPDDGIGGVVFEEDQDVCTKASDAAGQASSEVVFYTDEVKLCVAKGGLNAKCEAQNKDQQTAYYNYLKQVALLETACNK